MNAMVLALRGILVQCGGLVLSYFWASLLQFLFDLVDEVVESALEREEAKANMTPEKSDDRRLAVLRKYFEGWKEFKKAKK